ncbi:hypothetical protein AB1Y20_001772 [Prymnesium parvum]|uniref:Sulfhydryl oxidase n=1 Tax=Prymnesium parvum TaxID=97485 RepID=A0AB34K8R1_PRYPA
MLISRGGAGLALGTAFLLGGATTQLLHSHGAHPLHPATPPAASSYEERGPPSKQELGRSAWTLLHTLAANFPEGATPRQRARAETFVRALGGLYPCAACAAHFREYMAAHPVQAASRQELSLWLCGAHNAVNRRNGKEDFYCDMGVLDARWKDCGCEKNASLA